MAVKIGSAKISEKGTANGVKGDQTKKEVGTQDWYLHPKGWNVFRAKDPKKAEKIAYCMQALCDNDCFGYGQNDRDDCLPILEKVGYDPSKVTTPVNIDCSMGILVCCRYAGINIRYDAQHPFYTGNIEERLMATGEFEEFKDPEHCQKSDNLKRGDILCTQTKGHTVAVLNNGGGSGKYKANTWYSDEKGWWYAKDADTYAKNEWLIINKHKYYFNLEGYAVSGKYRIGEKLYYFAMKSESVEFECAMMRTSSEGNLVIVEEK